MYPLPDRKAICQFILRADSPHGPPDATLDITVAYIEGDVKILIAHFRQLGRACLKERLAR